MCRKKEKLKFGFNWWAVAAKRKKKHKKRFLFHSKFDFYWWMLCPQMEKLNNQVLAAITASPPETSATNQPNRWLPRIYLNSKKNREFIDFPRIPKSQIQEFPRISTNSMDFPNLKSVSLQKIISATLSVRDCTMKASILLDIFTHILICLWYLWHFATLSVLVPGRPQV